MTLDTINTLVKGLELPAEEKERLTSIFKEVTFPEYLHYFNPNELEDVSSLQDLRIALINKLRRQFDITPVNAEPDQELLQKVEYFIIQTTYDEDTGKTVSELEAQIEVFIDAITRITNQDRYEISKGELVEAIIEQVRNRVPDTEEYGEDYTDVSQQQYENVTTFTIQQVTIKLLEDLNETDKEKVKGVQQIGPLVVHNAEFELDTHFVYRQTQTQRVFTVELTQEGYNKLLKHFQNMPEINTNKVERRKYNDASSQAQILVDALLQGSTRNEVGPNHYQAIWKYKNKVLDELQKFNDQQSINDTRNAVGQLTKSLIEKLNEYEILQDHTSIEEAKVLIHRIGLSQEEMQVQLWKYIHAERYVINNVKPVIRAANFLRANAELDPGTIIRISELENYDGNEEAHLADVNGGLKPLVTLVQHIVNEGQYGKYEKLIAMYDEMMKFNSQEYVIVAICNILQQFVRYLKDVLTSNEYSEQDRHYILSQLGIAEEG